LSVIERNTMFFDVDMVFSFAPLKFHKPYIMRVCIIVNTIILEIYWKINNAIFNIREISGMEKKRFYFSGL
jgi:hypothetical protein